MADEDLDLELESEQDNINKVEKRIKTLSEKVKLTSQERDEKTKLLEEKETLLTNTSKERDFYKSFSQVSSKHPGASEYQDKIWERVQKGTDLEEATVAVLYKEGKLQGSPAPTPEKFTAAGGSANTALGNDSDKTPDKMSQDERRAQLLDMESKGEFHL